MHATLRSRCLSSCVHNESRVQKEMAIPVYLLRSRDGETGFCFRTDGSRSAAGAAASGEYSVYLYSAIDLFNWRGNGRGHITKLDTLDKARWTESLHIFTVSLLELLQYEKHITSWATTAGNYSLFEDLGSTGKSFAEESVRFFLSGGQKLVALTSLKVPCRHLIWTEKLRLDSSQIRDADAWYAILEQLDYAEYELSLLISENGQYYYRELVDGEARYYHMKDVRVTYSSDELSLEADLVMRPMEIKPAQVGQDFSTTTTTTTVDDTGTNSGLLLIVFLFTILIVLLVIAVLVLEYYNTEELIGAHPVEALPSVVPV